MNSPTPSRRRSWPLIAGFVCIVAFQTLVAALSIEIISDVRAYVTGESMYSKAQKDAQIYLLAYATNQQEDDYQRFLDALTIPLNDRVAREALQKVPPDIELASRSFLASHNHPDDVPGGIRLFRWLHAVPVMKDVIARWTEGDEVIEQMRLLVDRAREQMLAGNESADAVVELRQQAPILNARLTRLEADFSDLLGQASRQTQSILMALDVSVGVLLAVGGALFIRFSSRARALSQAAAHASEQRMSKLVDAVHDGVMTIDSQDRIVLFNGAAQKLFGLSEFEAVGQPVERVIPRRLQQHVYGSFHELGSEGHRGTAVDAIHELTGLRVDGHTFPLEASFSRLHTERGMLLTAVLRDVTELHAVRAERRAREALEATSRAKTEFLSRMSHELRTPLNAVLGFAQLLRIDRLHPPSASQLERIRHIENAGAHLLALVNDVLDFSRVESGQMTISLEPIDARSMALDALSMVSALASEHRIELVSPAPSAHELWVQADRVRLRQVLVNLLSNAVKYNRPGGSVTVRIALTGNQCEFRIVDTGVGMRPEQLAHLFEPFNRLGAENSKIEGTGIGLVLSRRLVELMQGTLTIESRVGQGTTASLTIGCCDAPSQPAPLHAPPSQHDLLDGPMTVLYAEDNEVNIMLVQQIASFRPAIVLRIARTGEEAFRMAQQQQPDLLLLDMNLGDMTGLELAAQLRASPATAGVRLVALSADALPEQIEAALSAGFESYLTKPIDFRKLLNVFDGRPQVNEQGVSVF